MKGFALALFCALLGLVPAIGFRLVHLVLNASRQGFGAALADASPVSTRSFTAPVQFQSLALFAPLAVGAVLTLMFLVAYGISKLGAAPRRAAAPWLCGYVREADCHRYSAHNFYGEIKRYFRWVGGTPQPSKPRGLKELT